MRHYLLSLALIILAAALVSCGAGPQSGQANAYKDVYQFEVGEPVPDLVLPSLEDGKPASLAEFRGRKFILHMFASW